jgi:hypothetical protein
MQNISSVQYKILELVEQWNATLCTTSRFKDDFKHINDMYRLLGYKGTFFCFHVIGYRFPGLVNANTAVLTAPDVFIGHANFFIESFKNGRRIGGRRQGGSRRGIVISIE